MLYRFGQRAVNFGQIVTVFVHLEKGNDLGTNLCLFSDFFAGQKSNKKTYKLLTCRFLSCFCLVLSRPFSGERGSFSNTLSGNHRLSYHCISMDITK